MGSQRKIVKILSGISEVEMIPTSAGLMKVTLNGEELTLPTVGEQLIKRDQEGRILLIVQRFQDAVFVHLPRQMLKVLSNGSVIEVVAPQLLKSRAVGLCGDMNGERSADLKTPHVCLEATLGCPFLHAEQVRSPSWVRALLWHPSR